MKLLKQNDTQKGQIIANPELRYTPNGKAVATFAIMINNKPLVCEAWQTLAEEIIERDLQPGAEIEVTGNMKIRKFTDREDIPRQYPYLSVIAIGV